MAGQIHLFADFSVQGADCSAPKIAMSPEAKSVPRKPQTLAASLSEQNKTNQQTKNH